MKKLFVTALIFLSCGSAYALPVGNLADPSLLTWGILSPAYNCRGCNPCCFWFDYWALKVGYYGDFVFNRNLKIQGEGLDQGENIQRTTLFTNAGYLALNLCNKVDIFGTLGASKITITTNETSWFLAGAAEGRLQWDNTFSWSAGAKGTIFQKSGFFLGVEGQYFQSCPELNDYVSYESGLFNYFQKARMTYKEWQVGTGISYALTCFCPNLKVVPYAAAKWAWVRFDTHSFNFVRTGTPFVLTIFNLKAAKHWGAAVGTSIAICDIVDFTVEGRWGDETALYVNGKFRF
jgi:major outer membrane protein